MKVVLVLLVVILSLGCLSSPDEQPEQTATEIVEVPAAEVVNITPIETVELPAAQTKFNISITFNGYNNSNILIVVESPTYVIKSTPIITCDDIEYKPFFNDSVLYFYECNCTEMSKAVLEFDEQVVTFFLLDEGNGWDFSLVDG